MQVNLFTIFSTCLLAGCIGTDHIDDPVVGPAKIEVNTHAVALKVGEAFALEAAYFDIYGIERTVVLDWLSSDTDVVEVSPQGAITAIGGGQAVVHAMYEEVISMPVEVNVVLDEFAVATVSIAAAKNVLELNEKLVLSASVKNINGELLDGKTVSWFSENSAIATVSAAGEVTAVSGGEVDIHAKVEGVKSNVLSFTVVGGRSGSFVAAGGYKAKGTATLAFEGSSLVLKLSDDFETSFALGTYIYLSNSTNASNTLSGGKEIAQVTVNGAHTFNVSQKFPSIQLYDYRYVVILCKPAVVTFGYADLN